MDAILRTKFTKLLFIIVYILMLILISKSLREANYSMSSSSFILLMVVNLIFKWKQLKNNDNYLKKLVTSFFYTFANVILGAGGSLLIFKGYPWCGGISLIAMHIGLIFQLRKS